MEKSYELYNELDGYQDKGSLKEMRDLKRIMENDDKENNIDCGKYWIEKR